MLLGDFLLLQGPGCGLLQLSIRFRTLKIVLLVVPKLAMIVFGVAPVRSRMAMSSRFLAAISRLICLTFLLLLFLKAGILTVILM